MRVSEASLWPDPEPVDEIGLLPPTAESASATAAMENAGEPDDAFGSGADSVGRGVEARTSLITHGEEIDGVQPDPELDYGLRSDGPLDEPLVPEIKEPDEHTDGDGEDTDGEDTVDGG